MITLYTDWLYELQEDIANGNCADDENYNTRTVMARIWRINDPCVLDALFFIVDTVGCVSAMGTAILFLYMTKNAIKKPIFEYTEITTNYMT